MIERGLSVFDPPRELVDACGVTPKLSEGERVLWIGTPGRFSSFFCTTSVFTWIGFGLALFVIVHGIYGMTPAEYAIEGLARNRWIVVGIIVSFVLAFQLMSLRIYGGFAYILTTKRMLIKVDRKRWLARLFRYFKGVCDADGFAAYDLRYLNGTRVYAGLGEYGNVSVARSVDSLGKLRELSDAYRAKLVFRDGRCVKVFRRWLACIHVGETVCNVYSGIKDVSRLGEVMNNQCAARLGQR